MSFWRFQVVSNFANKSRILPLPSALNRSLCPSAIDTIGEDDIVTARIGSSPVPDKADPDLVPRSPLPDAVERFKITFVTAEHALCHARQTPKEQSEAKTGVLAFDGELINGNMTLVCVCSGVNHILCSRCDRERWSKRQHMFCNGPLPTRWIWMTALANTSKKPPAAAPLLGRSKNMDSPVLFTVVPPLMVRAVGTPNVP